jgi:1L-myo-inositol 1-phosphate cytidylyltransferase
MVAWHILDGVDGQLARLTNSQSEFGKVIKDFNAIDTGLFLCTPIIFDALEASFEAGDESISGAMSVLARWGKARTFDIGGRLWIDVDDPAAFAHTEKLIEEGRL